MQIRIGSISSLIYDEKNKSLRFKKGKEYILSLKNLIITLALTIFTFLLLYFLNVDKFILYTLTFTALIFNSLFSFTYSKYIYGDLLKMNRDQIFIRGKKINCDYVHNLLIKCECKRKHGDSFFSYICIMYSYNNTSYDLLYVDEYVSKDCFEKLFSRFGLTMYWGDKT